MRKRSITTMVIALFALASAAGLAGCEDNSEPVPAYPEPETQQRSPGSEDQASEPLPDPQGQTGQTDQT
ncbi:MAG: hypothetical protein ACLFV3_12790, partial [Phycisphaeraceae bacterium]